MHAATNRQTQAALAFHAATKYRVFERAADRVVYAMGTPPELERPFWEEDWSIEPRPYKVYTSLEPIPLPTELLPTAAPALAVLARTGAEQAGSGVVPTLASLGQLGKLSVGLLNRRVTDHGRVVEFRTAGGTGARYHLELYFVCAALPDLPAGVYHYGVHDHALRQLRAGDLRGALVEAAGGEPSLTQASVVLILTSTFWRNAWRYKARAYRHTYWDAGTSLANGLAVAAALDLPTRLVLGYADAAVNFLLGVDGEREAAVALCAVGAGASAPPAVADVPPIAHPTLPVSAAEVTFPAIERMHLASSLDSGAAAAAWRSQPLERQPALPQHAPIPLRPLPDDALPTASIEQVILARRSTRRYASQEPLSFELFSTALARSVHRVAADCLAPGAWPLHDGYLIVNAVDGLAPGLYLHRAREGSLEPLRLGDFRAEAAHLALDQAYAGQAHVNSYYLAELAPILARYGNRGYRLAQLEAALSAGRLHLAAQALGLGAVGSTSLDDEVIAFFSPRAADASYLFITVFGLPRPLRVVKPAPPSPLPRRSGEGVITVPVTPPAP